MLPDRSRAALAVRNVVRLYPGTRRAAPLDQRMTGELPATMTCPESPELIGLTGFVAVEQMLDLVAGEYGERSEPCEPAPRRRSRALMS